MLAVSESADSWTLWHILAIAIALTGELLAILFVYRILVRGGSTASTLLWVAVILAAPWLGLLLYYLLPRRLQLRQLHQIRRRGARARAREAPDDAHAARQPVAGLAALFGEESGGLRHGNDVEWIPGAREFFAAAEEAIAAARHEIHCVVYILRPDQAGLRFLEWLRQAARRGVIVRLLYDSLGSFGLKASHLAALREAGGHAEAFLPLLWKRRPFTVNMRNHRKLLLVDGEIGFVGGRNIGDEYKTGRLGRTQLWLDAMASVRGPITGVLQEVFVEDWCTATDELLSEVQRPSPAACGQQSVAVACSGPDRDQSPLWFAIVQALADARETIELSSPYLVPPPMLLFALQLAVARGVRVRVHTNGPRAEAAVLYHAQRSFYRRLLRAGVEIYETIEDYNHSKLLVADGKTVVIGSANLDLRSANLNFEIAVVVIDSPSLADAVLATIEERCHGSRRMTEQELPTNPFVRAVDGFCGLLSPLL